MHLVCKKFCVKFEFVFSDPECPFVFCVCDILNAINIMLRGRQPTLESDVLYSKRSVFSFKVVLLNFLKYRRSILFLNIVVSAFAGFVLYLCHDLSCLIIGSKFCFFCINCSVIFFVGDKKIFSTSIFGRGIESSGP